jgi:hypothetical protein
MNIQRDYQSAQDFVHAKQYTVAAVQEDNNTICRKEFYI